MVGFCIAHVAGLYCKVHGCENVGVHQIAATLHACMCRPASKLGNLAKAKCEHGLNLLTAAWRMFRFGMKSFFRQCSNNSFEDIFGRPFAGT